MKPGRYDLNRPIPEAALRANRAWLIAYDEEGTDGQDEATIGPSDSDDPSLPGFVTIEARFADGSTVLGLAGGDFGVGSLDDLDDMRLYEGKRAWALELGPESCQAEHGSESFFEEFDDRLPMVVLVRLDGMFDTPLPDFAFTVESDGSVRPGAV